MQPEEKQYDAHVRAWRYWTGRKYAEWAKECGNEQGA